MQQSCATKGLGGMLSRTMGELCVCGERGGEEAAIAVGPIGEHKLGDGKEERKSSWLDLLVDQSRGRASTVDGQGETENRDGTLDPPTSVLDPL